MSKKKLVEIKNLKTHFKVGDQWATAVHGVDLDIYEGETLGIVGESGSGKSVSVLSLIQLIPNPPGEVVEGEFYFKGEKIFDGEELAQIKEVPKYRYFRGLSENARKTVAILFFAGWLVLHVALNIPGVLLFFISLILNSVLTGYLFFNSPYKKTYNKWRENMFQRMRDLRGDEIAMIFQEPMTSLNPVYTVGFQIIETLKPLTFQEYIKNGIINLAKSVKTTPKDIRIKTTVFFGLFVMIFTQLINGWTFEIATVFTSLLKGAVFPTIVAYIVIGLDKLISEQYHTKWKKLFEESVILLEMVGIPSAKQRMDDYPHQFSGGMRQRVMIAMALAKNPSLLIADEPTTALDVTIQAQILELMIELKNKKTDAAIVLITHDLAVIAETCERVVVMYGGRIQEVASAEELFGNPLHPYTHGLLRSIPRPDKDTKKERLDIIEGIVPSILDMPVGCKFCTRCDVRIDKCDTDEPPLREIKEKHFVRCHVVETENMRPQA